MQQFVWVDNCTFDDKAVTFPAAMITNGITVGRGRTLMVLSSTFDNLNAAVVPVAVDYVELRDCAINQCSLGVLSDANRIGICLTEFQNNAFSTALYYVGHGTLRANGIGNTSLGCYSSAGGINTYWRNEFDWYGRGILAVGAGAHRLRDYAYRYLAPTEWQVMHIAGRNEFAQSATRPTHWPAPQQFNDIELAAVGAGIPTVNVAMGTTTATLDIPSLPTGSYILRCQAGSTAKAIRLTIQR